MKQTLRFLLSISNTKMVVISKEGKQNCYVAHKGKPIKEEYNFDKLANCISEYS